MPSRRVCNPEIFRLSALSLVNDSSSELLLTVTDSWKLLHCESCCTDFVSRFSLFVCFEQYPAFHCGEEAARVGLLTASPFSPSSSIIALFLFKIIPQNGGRRLPPGSQRSRLQIPGSGPKCLQRPNHPGRMDPEEAGLDSPRKLWIRFCFHQGREGRWSGSRNHGDWQTLPHSKRWPAEDEPTKVWQGGRHGRVDLPQWSFSPAQHQGTLLLWTHLRKYLHSYILQHSCHRLKCCVPHPMSRHHLFPSPSTNLIIFNCGNLFLGFCKVMHEHISRTNCLFTNSWAVDTPCPVWLTKEDTKKRLDMPKDENLCAGRNKRREIVDNTDCLSRSWSASSIWKETLGGLDRALDYLSNFRPGFLVVPNDWHLFIASLFYRVKLGIPVSQCAAPLFSEAVLIYGSIV